MTNRHKVKLMYNNFFLLHTHRFYAVLKPLNLKEHRGKIMIGIAWILSAVCSAPQVNFLSFLYLVCHDSISFQLFHMSYSNVMQTLSKSLVFFLLLVIHLPCRDSSSLSKLHAMCVVSRFITVRRGNLIQWLCRLWISILFLASIF